MEEDRRKILRIASIVIALIALAIAASKFLLNSDLPIVLPLLLFLSAIGLFIGSSQADK